MTPSKFGVLGQFIQITQQGQRRKERMKQHKNVVELEDFIVNVLNLHIIDLLGIDIHSCRENKRKEKKEIKNGRILINKKNE
jgi:hypothetical protein